MSMDNIYISGTGLWIPPHGITNDELMASYNSYVEKFNTENAKEIAAGSIEELSPSSSEFVEKASGIKHRYVIEKDHALDPNFVHDQAELRATLAARRGRSLAAPEDRHIGPGAAAAHGTQPVHRRRRQRQLARRSRRPRHVG